MYFPVNFAKFLKTPFLTGHIRWLLLKNGVVIISTHLGNLNHFGFSGRMNHTLILDNF